MQYILYLIKLLPAFVEALVALIQVGVQWWRLAHWYAQTGQTHKQPVVNATVVAKLSSAPKPIPQQSPSEDAVAATAAAEKAENDIIDSDDFKRIERGE